MPKIDIDAIKHRKEDLKRAIAKEIKAFENDLDLDLNVMQQDIDLTVDSRIVEAIGCHINSQPLAF